MGRQAIAFFVLLALLWQSLAVAHAGVLDGVLSDHHHASLHWLEQEHHHHDDGSYHDDDSSESRQHLFADNAVGSPVVPCAAQSCGVQPANLAVRTADDTVVPQPYLDGLLRPPRSTP